MNEMEEVPKRYVPVARAAVNIPRDSVLWRTSVCYWGHEGTYLRLRHADTPQEHVYAPAPSANELIVELLSRGYQVHVCSGDSGTTVVTICKKPEECAERQEFRADSVLYALLAAVCGIADRDDMHLRTVGWKHKDKAVDDAKDVWTKSITDARGHIVDCAIERTDVNEFYIIIQGGGIPYTTWRASYVWQALATIDKAVQRFLKVKDEKESEDGEDE